MNKEYKFSFIPYINLIKVESILSNKAKKTFNVNWDEYYKIEFGWLILHKTIIII